MSGVLNVLVGGVVDITYHDFSHTISSDTTNFNLYNWLRDSDSWNEVDAPRGTLTINSGIYVYSTSISTGGLIIPSFPAFTEIEIDNNGLIHGKGGKGSSHDSTWDVAATAAEAGGPALVVSHPITVDNTGGKIEGGGGGGGVGASQTNDKVDVAGGGGGGGGAGKSPGAGGTGNPGNSSGAPDDGPGGSGSVGTTTTGGAGGTGFSGGGSAAGNGGAGGTVGSVGTDGVDPGTSDHGGDTPGGAAGYSVSGYSNITWTATGTLTGPTTG